MPLCIECEFLVGQLFYPKDWQFRKRLHRSWLDESCELCNLFPSHRSGQHRDIKPDICDALASLLARGHSGVAIAFGFSSAGSYMDSLQFLAEPSSEAFKSGDITGALLENTGSIESLGLVVGWFDSCRRDHDGCCSTLGGQRLDNALLLPTRILYVGSSDDNIVKLVETWNWSRKEEQWAALSHCWGGKMPISTTHATLQSHREGIALSELPQTFCDAVKVARALGLEYLWIDMLCIIQDDPEDWNRESARMGYVYECAENANQGCFVNMGHQGSMVELPYIKNNVQLGRFFASKALDYGGSSAFAPLIGRAWALQERALARRTVVYTSSGVWWECRNNKNLRVQA
ncbi:heterokaryon incompatibility protein-domain-containing protein [Hypoxylon trugodes]|uniref:heterokaryon incompatibility protein-domain-containing protein n=1 Tax=Hypoxylon trugodes TaxID=326681 RepID=UPI00219A7A98|nr:heterokaryon incompatibility protein-domain-containing protein [Hypoxylon trugodes]KAI1385676.1 heterokaryon incompatibility protein-domain-containing protein [Hypoxylon trugodes]